MIVVIAVTGGLVGLGVATASIFFVARKRGAKPSAPSHKSAGVDRNTLFDRMWDDQRNTVGPPPLVS